MSIAQTLARFFLSRHLISVLHQPFASPTPQLLFSFASPFLSILSVSRSSSFSVSSPRRRIITQEPESHFVLIERNARRYASRTRASTFPSLDARRIFHDSSRVSEYLKRGGGEQEGSFKRGNETTRWGTVALLARRKSHRSFAKYVSTFVPRPRYTYNASCAVTTMRLIP